ncbi:hypothetical protein YC2023_076945 [Brassica napus]
MKKSQKVQAEDEPVMLDTFPKTLRDHTAAQHETSIDSSFGHEVDVENRDSATHAQDWIVEETDVELGDTCETLGTSSRDDLMREFDESDFESDDEEKIDMEFDLDDE